MLRLLRNPNQIEQTIKILAYIVSNIVRRNGMSQINHCPEAIMKKLAQLTCIVIDLEVLDDGPIFSGVSSRQESDYFVCKHRRTEEAMTKVCIFVYEVFTNNFFQSYTAIAFTAIKSETNTKSHRLFLIFNSLEINTTRSW